MKYKAFEIQNGLETIRISFHIRSCILIWLTVKIKKNYKSSGFSPLAINENMVNHSPRLYGDFMRVFCVNKKLICHILQRGKRQHIYIPETKYMYTVHFQGDKRVHVLHLENLNREVNAGLC